MNTPILDYVKEYNSSNTVRMHMPGHKGKNYLGFEGMDITEIKGADSLYHADGIIAESEANATKLFDSGKTVYSTEGSSQCIKAMLHLALINWKKSNAGRPVVVAARNAHVSFIYAAMLLDFDVKWLWPENSDGNIISCSINYEELENAVNDSQVAAVYITSPDYLGNVSDIKRISDICHSKEKLLIVDNAHGAYLRFLEGSNYRHPLSRGADMCCDSAHKTLPVLTGGAYLHLNKGLDSFFYDKVKLSMNIFGSTSPSYLILESLDNCNKYISEGYKEKLDEFINKLNVVKTTLRALGYTILETDPLKLTFRVNNGTGFSDFLRNNGIECEYADNEYVVLMLTPDIEETKLEKLVAILSVNEEYRLQLFENSEIVNHEMKTKYTIREAMFLPQERISVNDALGRVCGVPLISCPPAIPIVVSGEIIDDYAIKTLKKYGIDYIECIID